MVNRTAILDRLNALQDYVEKLRPFQNLTLAELNAPENYAQYWAVQRGLELAAQATIDIATHLQIALRLGQSDEYRESIRALGSGADPILPPAFADEFSAVAGFRNVIVHQYLDIDPSQVYEILQHGLADFEKFIDYIYLYLEE